MKTKILPAILFLVIYGGCRKENIPPVNKIMMAIQLDHAFSYSIDSSCIAVPNIFTPNSDGINDILWIHGMYIASFHLTIYNQANLLVFTSTSMANPWNGYQNTSSGTGIFDGRYRYILSAVTLSNQLITAQRYVQIVTHPSTDCLTANPPALFGDMMDGRYCPPLYTTQETVCYQ
jgi:gliding motility-associated-like protein